MGWWAGELAFDRLAGCIVNGHAGDLGPMGPQATKWSECKLLNDHPKGTAQRSQGPKGPKWRPWDAAQGIQEPKGPKWIVGRAAIRLAGWVHCEMAHGPTGRPTEG